MDVATVVILAWPVKPELIGIDQVTDPGQRRKVADFIVKCRAQRRLSLDELIRFAKRDNTPSIVLVEGVMEKLLAELTPRCRQHTIEGIRKRLTRPLSLFPHFAWSEYVLFGKAGEVSYDPRIATLDRVRKDLVTS